MAFEDGPLLEAVSHSNPLSEKMALNKKQRAALREKFGGKCAYCGCELGERWHADHIEPVVRNDWLKVPRAPDYPERDTVENMNPACAPCNIDKHSMSLEAWRGIISRSNDVLHRDVPTFRRAVRYGLVQLAPAPVVFYFERLAGPGAFINLGRHPESGEMVRI